MQSKDDEKELQSFLEKVDDLGSILNDLTSTDEEAQKRAMIRADEKIAKQEKLKEKNKSNMGFDRTVINKNAYAGGKNSGPRFLEQNTSQEHFLASLEADCQRRADARKQRHQKASILKDRGNAAFHNEQFEDAVKLYTEATKIAKDLTPLYTNRAAAYLKLDKYQEAIDDCDFALRIDKSWIKGLVLKAKSLQKLHKYDEAVEEFNKVVEIDKTKAKMIKGFLVVLQNDKRTYELEKSVQPYLQECEGNSMSIPSVINSILTRLGEDDISTPDTTNNLMYYAGGFRTLQALLVDERSRTLFRTARGFKTITGSGSVLKFLHSEANCKTGALPHMSDLVVATVALCTAACSHLPENLNVLLSDGDASVMFLNFLCSWNEQVKRSAIIFFHEASLTPTSRTVIQDTVDCVRLSTLLLQPKTRKADANSASSAALLNMSLDKKFCDLLVRDFEAQLLPLYEGSMNDVGVACYEALRLRMDSLNNLVRNPLICAAAGGNTALRKVCMEALDRCVKVFKGGLSNPCGLEQLLNLLYSMLKARKDETCSNVIVSLLAPFLDKVKDSNLLANLLGLLDLLTEQWKSCVDTLFADCHGFQVFNHLFRHLKQDDPLLKTHSLKMICCCGQHKPGYLRPLIRLDKDYAVLRTILFRDNNQVDKVNQSHVALMLGSLSVLDGGLEPILRSSAEADVVRRLLVLCRDAPNKQARINCSIALGKMAVYDKRFLLQLREHDGINILSKQNLVHLS